MSKGEKSSKAPNGPKIESILRAKRLPYSARPATEPPCKVNALLADIPEKDRFLIAEADVSADMRLGDPGLLALRKCRFIIENAQGAFSDPHLLELILCRAIRMITEYGEPEGAQLLLDALAHHMDMRSVREAVSMGISQIGDEGSLNLLLRLLAVDASSPETHLHSIISFIERYPDQASRAIMELREMEADCPGVSEAILEIQRSAEKG